MADGGNPNELPGPADLDRPAETSPTEADLATQSPGGYQSAGHDPYAALRFANYGFYLGGWILSIVGRQIQSVAVGWDVAHRLGGDSKSTSLALGLVGGVQAVPMLLLSLPAGQLADRADRRLIVIIGATLSAVCSLGLFWVSRSQGPIWSLYLLLGLNSACLSVAWPARSALLPQIIPNRYFANAATWNSSAFQVASVLGPAIGGLVVNFTIAGAYLIDAAGAIAFAVCLILLKLRPAERTREPATLENLLAGIRFVRKTRVIFATITLDLFAVLLGGATALLPVFAKDVLKVDAVHFGWLKASPAIGAFLSAMIVAHLPPMRRAGLAMLWAVAGFGVATILFGATTNFWVALIALGLTGAFDNVSVVVRHTLVQVLPPDSMRGRVAAVNNVFVGASNQLGELESGLVGKLIGPVWSVITGGVGTLLVVAAVAWHWPEVRRLGSLTDVRATDNEIDSPPGSGQRE